MQTPTAIPMPTTMGAPAPVTPSPMGGNVVSLGAMRAVPLATLEAEAANERAEAERVQASPLVTGVAGHIRTHFEQARQAKRNMIEDRLLKSMRARRREYDPDKMALIREQGGSEVYAGLTGAKCRAAGGWLRDVLMGTGSERPWAIRPTPLPDLPPEINDRIVEEAMGPIRDALRAGAPPDQAAVTQLMSLLRDQALTAIREEAVKRSERMADKMEDQLVEGRFLQALDEFLDDLTTFPTAFLKGPVIRMKAQLSWGPNGEPIVETKLHKSWERVSPFNIYPSPGACHIQDGFLIEKHRLSRQDLNEMKGVEGYSDAAIDAVLEAYGTGGLNAWMDDTSMQADAEGKDTSASYANPDGLIDALQYWGSVPGSLLLDWGLEKDEVPEPTKEYHVEAWLIGSHVIKAVLNYDPLCRKPYYAASYETVPGSVWGNSVADLVRDAQDIVNACARSLVNNMALASGPQVGVLVDRMAAGEDITQLQPWRIWQMKSDPLAGGTQQQPIQFFQPQSNVNDLLIVLDKFSQLADEYSGIPRYLTGDTTGGAGRTASGLSMLISNAGKSIKQVISNIDIGVMGPVLDRLYYHNMRYEDDPDLKGDVNIVARGAAALIAKEAAQVRRNEFLLATGNPIDMQIVGVEGRAEVLREVAKGLDMNTDKIVPPMDVLRQKILLTNAIQNSAGQPGAGGSPPALNGPAPAGSGQVLMDGAPTVDNFTPPKANP